MKTLKYEDGNPIIFSRVKGAGLAYVILTVILASSQVYS